MLHGIDDGVFRFRAGCQFFPHLRRHFADGKRQKQNQQV